MVLTDSGAVFDDEFEKVRNEDHVAFHEAMEQHTFYYYQGISKATFWRILETLDYQFSVTDAYCEPWSEA